jgi:hypothetical protein
MTSVLYLLSGSATLWAIYDSGGVVLLIIPVALAMFMLNCHMQKPPK